MSRYEATVETAEYIITVIERDCRNHNGRITGQEWDKKTRVYVDLGVKDPRTASVDGDEVAGELRGYKAMSKEGALAAVAELQRRNWEGPVVAVIADRVGVRFSWKAGCSCGCSCGCILDTRVTKDGTPLDIWVTLKAGMIAPPLPLA